MDWKRILKIFFGILTPIAVIWGGYYIWQTLNAPPAIPEPNNIPTQTLVDIPTTPSFSTVMETPIFDYWINSKTGAVYYLDLSGQVFKAGESDKPVNSQTLNNLNGIQISADGTLALAKFNYPALATFSIFNTVTNAWQPLPEGTSAAAWAASTSQLVYLDGKAGSLKILNVTSQKTQEVIKLNQKDIKLYWVNPSTILVQISAPSIEMPSSLWSLDLKTKLLKPLFRDEIGLALNWSLLGNYGLKLVNVSRVPRVSLINQAGGILKDLSFVTLPEKCAFSESKIYCGVPRFIRDGIQLPDDYYKKAVYFQDDIYSIDLISGESALLLNGDEILIDAYRLSLGNGKLYFLNRYDNKLYNLSL
ncbi:MAG: hypothetical protein Q8P76_02540 [bacterium]|nr:hypothetical protein [bacterium]